MIDGLDTALLILIADLRWADAATTAALVTLSRRLAMRQTGRRSQRHLSQTQFFHSRRSLRLF